MFSLFSFVYIVNVIKVLFMFAFIMSVFRECVGIINLVIKQTNVMLGKEITLMGGTST